MTVVVALAAAAAVIAFVRLPHRRPQTIGIELPESVHRRTEHRVLVGFGTLLLLGCLVIVGAGRGEGASSHAPASATGTTVVAVDVSSSVSWSAKTRVATALRSVARRVGERAGLVVFADAAAVVLPPTTPAAELARIAPFFGGRQLTSDGQALPPWLDATYSSAGPWAEAFLGGTSIASGLSLAGTVLRRAGIPGPEGRIVLLSDLQDGGREGYLGRTMRRLRRAGVEVDAVPLHAAPGDLELFRGLGAVIVGRPEQLAPNAARAVGTAAPRRDGAPYLAAWTVLFGAVLLALYGWSSPLRFRLRPAEGGP